MYIGFRWFRTSSRDDCPTKLNWKNFGGKELIESLIVGSMDFSVSLECFFCPKSLSTWIMEEYRFEKLTLCPTSVFSFLNSSARWSSTVLVIAHKNIRWIEGERTRRLLKVGIKVGWTAKNGRQRVTRQFQKDPSLSALQKCWSENRRSVLKNQLFLHVLSINVLYCTQLLVTIQKSASLVNIAMCTLLFKY